MHTNFTDRARVADLGGADSYATRLFDYEHTGRSPGCSGTSPPRWSGRPGGC
jgi:hypothetical protein